MLCNFSRFLQLSATLGILLPATSSPASRTPPAPFSPGFRPLCPPPHEIGKKVSSQRKSNSVPCTVYTDSITRTGLAIGSLVNKFTANLYEIIMLQSCKHFFFDQIICQSGEQEVSLVRHRCFFSSYLKGCQ